MKNILFITYKTNPIKGIGSIRNSKLAKYVSKAGYNVFVISTSNYKLFYQEEYIKNLKNQIKFYRIPTIDYQTIKFIILRIIKIFKKEKNRFYTIEVVHKEFYYNFLTLFPFNLLLDQGGLLYIIMSIFTALFLIKKYNIKYIFSSFSPFSDHIIAYFLKVFIPDLVWIADFRDLHLERVKEYGVNPFLFNINMLLDKLILKKADALSTVSKGLGERLKKYNKNVYVITNGFDPEEFIISYKSKIKDFSFLYAGALYEGKRDPSILLECLSSLIKIKKIKKKDIKLFYAGREGDLFRKFCIKYELEDIYYNLGFVSREEVIKKERECFFLILLTWSSDDEKGVLTGKFYEYLTSGRFIICIVNGKKDEELDEIFRKTRCGILIYFNEEKSKEKLVNFILKQYKNYKNRNYDGEYNWKEIYKFSYENISQELIKTFEKMEENKNV